MSIITLDFETYYDKAFSLSKLTTEEYIRSDQFEVIGVAVKKDADETTWHTGTREEIRQALLTYDIPKSLLLAHNTQFDGAILNWHFGIKAKGYLDTLCMARAIHGVEAGGSLKALAERYQIGQKGTEVNDALGKRRVDFTGAELFTYGRYCINDVELTYELFRILDRNFPTKELKVIDTTLKMFIQPSLVLDKTLLEQHLVDTKRKKEKLLEACTADKDTLMSNPKLAELLISLGVEPPMKISPTTGKETYAFAKSDEGFKELANHHDERVQAIISARLGTKSTLEETRTERFIGIADRGLMPVPLRYYAAHTGRWGGDDKINLQNLPSRGQNGGKLKKAICAPVGYTMIDCDSSQIEARIVGWLAGQTDLVEAFERKEDVYKIMASAIYQKEESEIEAGERFVGKTTILGAGYGMGSKKFGIQLKTFGVEIDDAEASRIVEVYRARYPRIPQLWQEANSSLDALRAKQTCKVGTQPQALTLTENGFLLPSGLYLNYPDLQQDNEGQYSYASRRGRIKIYGGKVVENVCQALARCVIAEQMLKIAKRYQVVLTVHDAVACIAPQEEAQEARKYVEECMRWRPDWAQTLPLNCESGMGKSYGDC